MKRFKVYIECTTYNHESFIQDAMNGFVIQKTDFPFVSVIIDDASTDDTGTVIRRFISDGFDLDESSVSYELEREYGTVLFAQHKVNKNCYFAVILLNENHYSQKKSKSPYIIDWESGAEYVAICEGDDYWTDPLKLQKQVDFLEKNRDYVMCCTAFTQTIEGTEERSTIQYDINEITIRDIIKGIWIGTLTVVYRKSAGHDYRVPFPDLPMGDLPFWCHLAFKGRIWHLKDVTANYRSLPNSASHSQDIRKQFLFELSAMRVREHYALLSGNVDVAKAMFSHNAHFYLDSCYYNKWFDFPIEGVWHFISEYGYPSGYDKVKYWGLRNSFNHTISEVILFVLGK